MEMDQQRVLDELKAKTQFPKAILERTDFWEELLTNLPNRLWQFFLERDGAAKFIVELPNVFPPETVEREGAQRRAWELTGLVYLNPGRFHEALSIFTALYHQMLKAQKINDTWICKGMPLVWMSECFSAMGAQFIAKKYLMLTLVEDAIAAKGDGSALAKTTGVYFRLVWGGGLSDAVLKDYAKNAYDLYTKNGKDGLFPEWILQELDKDWITDVPLPNEVTLYFANKYYVDYLMSKLGDKPGKHLERLAEYLLSCIPGCRTNRRQRAQSTEYDVVCSMDGLEVDFRSEFGRYFVCECKDWNIPADVTTLAKFCYFISSIKSRFGISGLSETKNAEREVLKAFQSSGITIVVIDEKDLKRVAEGYSFIALLRSKYEAIKLDKIQ